MFKRRVSMQSDKEIEDKRRKKKLKKAHKMLRRTSCVPSSTAANIMRDERDSN